MANHLLSYLPIQNMSCDWVYHLSFVCNTLQCWVAVTDYDWQLSGKIMCDSDSENKYMECGCVYFSMRNLTYYISVEDLKFAFQRFETWRKNRQFEIGDFTELSKKNFQNDFEIRERDLMWDLLTTMLPFGKYIWNAPISPELYLS